MVREQGGSPSQPLPATVAMEMGSWISDSLMRGGAGYWKLGPMRGTSNMSTLQTQERGQGRAASPRQVL